MSGFSSKRLETEKENQKAIAKYRMSKQEMKYVIALSRVDRARLGSNYKNFTVEEKVFIRLNTFGSRNPKAFKIAARI